MNGYITLLPVVQSLKKINIQSKHFKNNQSGKGQTSIQYVSPTKHLIDQAKETLKRNREELKNTPPTPGNITYSEQLGSKPKKPKKSKKPKKPKKSTTSKKDKLHNRYGK